MAESKLMAHADAELRRAGLHKKDADYGGALYGSVMRLVRAFVDDKHSGGSGARTLELFNRVVKFQALSPLTDDKAEWAKVDKGLWQNTRQLSCFSQDGGKTYYDVSNQGKTWATQKA